MPRSKSSPTCPRGQVKSSPTSKFKFKFKFKFNSHHLHCSTYYKEQASVESGQAAWRAYMLSDTLIGFLRLSFVYVM